MTTPSGGTARRQSQVPDSDLLHTANAGVIVERTAVAATGCGAAARRFAREVTESINKAHPGVATLFVYDEVFGTGDRLHWLIHLRSLDSYGELMLGGDSGTEPWNSLFAAGSVRETMLLPQFWGMYNTHVDAAQEKQTEVFRSTGRITGLPPAHHQTAIPPDRLLNSATSGMVAHRTAVAEYDLRSEARQFARRVAESINTNLSEDVSVLVYEEAFGQAERLHWLIHMRSIDAYYRLLELHVRDEEVRNLYYAELVPAEKGGGTWARLFRPGSLVDLAMTPQQWA